MPQKMLFCSMLYSENKTYDWKNSPISCCEDFQMTFCTEEMLYSAHWKSNKQKKFGHQAFNEYSAD